MCIDLLLFFELNMGRVSGGKLLVFESLCWLFVLEDWRCFSLVLLYYYWNWCWLLFLIVKFFYYFIEILLWVFILLKLFFLFIIGMIFFLVFVVCVVLVCVLLVVNLLWLVWRWMDVYWYGFIVLLVLVMRNIWNFLVLRLKMVCLYCVCSI